MTSWDEFKRSGIFLNCLQRLKWDSLLNVGCGKGQVLVGLKALFPNRRLVGLDLDPEMAEASKAKGFEAFVGDACDMKAFDDRSFDAVVSPQVIEHVPSEAVFLEETARVLRPGGLACISTVFKRKWGFWIYGGKLDPTHLHEYSNDSELLPFFGKAGLNVIGSEKLRIWRKGFVPVPGFFNWRIVALNGKRNA